jgi:hypothetical protein
MKTYLARILTLALMSSVFAVSAYATTIESVPFTITTSGTYKLDGDLALSGTGQTAIKVHASNVVIDLNGSTISTSDTTLSNLGIVTSSTTTNVTIQNGTIRGFGVDIFLSGGQALVHNLHLLGAATKILAESTCTSSVIQNCFFAGTGTASPSELGIILSGSSVVVKNNQFLSEYVGCLSSGNNSFIANYIGNCTYGLLMDSSDKYQANVTNQCTTPFTRGIPVGDANN